ncbi:MBL fold metallo-hydrolase [Paenibacillus sp. S-38]|uniref:MBL fold metallo-hydrolase n=1 Tax=Paenibacillus sp. S-38 TaxID=3416710 RepID=UPI003CFA9AC3
MKLRLIRHATLWIEYGGLTFLVDPMFSPEGANPPINGSTNERRNPLVPLPLPLESLLDPSAVLVTHTHQDHWDKAAAAALNPAMPLLCQPQDQALFEGSGFREVLPVIASAEFKGVTITRTGGRHGTGEIGQRMGPVSGFVLRAPGEPVLYITGDTIWCDEVKQALDEHRPDMTVVNAGGARFAQGDPITMDADDVTAVCRYAPYTRVAAVHMDTINHCLVTRDDLRSRLKEEGLLGQTAIPEDGDWL